MNVVDLVKEWLFAEGYRPEVDSDGDIHFRVEGISFYCTKSDDNQYLRILLPNIYKVDNNRVKVLELVNKLSKEYKVLKAYLVEDYLWLSIEMFIDSTPEVGDFMSRCISILQSGLRDVAQELL